MVKSVKNLLCVNTLLDGIKEPKTKKEALALWPCNLRRPAGATESRAQCVSYPRCTKKGCADIRKASLAKVSKLRIKE